MLPAEFYAIEKAVDDLNDIIAEGATYEAIAAVRNRLIETMVSMIEKGYTSAEMAPTRRKERAESGYLCMHD